MRRRVLPLRAFWHGLVLARDGSHVKALAPQAPTSLFAGAGGACLAAQWSQRLRRPDCCSSHFDDFAILTTADAADCVTSVVNTVFRLLGLDRETKKKHRGRKHPFPVSELMVYTHPPRIVSSMQTQTGCRTRQQGQKRARWKVGCEQRSGVPGTSPRVPVGKGACVILSSLRVFLGKS